MHLMSGHREKPLKMNENDIGSAQGEKRLQHGWLTEELDSFQLERVVAWYINPMSSKKERNYCGSVPQTGLRKRNDLLATENCRRWPWSAEDEIARWLPKLFKGSGAVLKRHIDDSLI
ncbi:hypothetical protein CEXT_38201 [Caerostris extrusa]|uniref:Uncharacterized protein n=1 Tax=Caerostris extrusa TaxID=172846 RepID=A0AAV4WE24_CAEEX|nr:hypothetical protein CEXT_38201 [Caerostris extrusa]